MTEKNVVVKIKDTKEDYNPFEHREVAKPNSDFRSLANLLKSSLGSGILAIPLAFANSGWGLGLVCTIIIGFLCTHCVQIFVESSREVCRLEKKPLMGYAETVQAVFEHGPKRLRRFSVAARKFATGSLLLTYLGVCCIFTVLIADSVKQLLDTYLPVTILSTTTYCAILMVPLCIITQIRHLKFLAPFSAIANLLLITVCVICFYYIFREKIQLADRKVVGSAARFPAFLSTVIFAMEGIGVVMPVENDMKNPKHFLGCPGVLSIAMVLITVLYSLVGLFGYLRYGDALRGAVTLNLPMDDIPAICAKVFIALSIFFTYPLHFYVAIDSLMKVVKPYVPDKYTSMAEVGVRIFIVLFCGAIAASLPMLEQIINIVGALFYSLLGLIIPAIVEMVLKWENLGKFRWIFWKNLLLVLFGFFCMISGCSVTIQDIVTILNEKTE